VKPREAPPAEVERDVAIPQPLAALGRKLLGAGQRLLYRELYDTTVRGGAHIPRDRNFLVVANHASHLDMGLVKVALGDQGEKLTALAAADYFFDTPLKRAYFENFTNLIPMDREGSVRKSLRAAVETLRRGMHVLVFPEGTRSRDGAMGEFKPTAGYLALHCGVDTLPVYIHGTFQALPPGNVLPRSAKLEVIIGQPIRVEDLRRRTAELPKGEAHKEATRIMERAVRNLTASSRAPARSIWKPADTGGTSPSPEPGPGPGPGAPLTLPSPPAGGKGVISSPSRPAEEVEAMVPSPSPWKGEGRGEGRHARGREDES
jgi:long-chain acyl-CoA synthetase